MLKHFSFLICALMALCAFIAPVAAQSPNTSSMIVVVEDQNRAVVKGARISVTNTATGAMREAVSGDEGRATIVGLPLTGEYKVSVSMSGLRPRMLPA